MERQRTPTFSPASCGTPPQSGGVVWSAETSGDRATISDLPRSLPVLPDEIAILRAYLADEISNILFGDG